MSIHKIGSDLVRPLPDRGNGAPGRRGDRDAVASHARAERADQVGFSAEALTLAEQAMEKAEGLTGERLEQLRHRLANGFYQDPAVAEEVARRLLQSGDLEVVY